MLISAIKHITTYPNQEDFHLFDKVKENLNFNPDQENFENEFLPSCHVALLDDVPVGRFAIYINDALSYQGEKAICLGAYHCIDDNFVSDGMLRYAADICESLRYKHIIGPMNGSTWHRYRFAKGDVEKSFFLDVNNPDYYNQQFISAGFGVIAEYCSNLDENLSHDPSALEKMEKHFQSKKAKLRNIDLEQLESELFKIGKFSNLAFGDNFLFTPIAEEKFVGMYKQLKQVMDPRFIWIVENEENEIESIFFAIPDITNQESKNLIIKTIAVKKNSPFRGIATFLSRKLNMIASTQGYDNIIHALMIKGNESLNASKKYGVEMKNYALYGKTLIK